MRSWVWQHDRRAFFRTQRATDLPPPEGYGFGELTSGSFGDDALLLRRQQAFRERLGGAHRLHRYTDDSGATAAYAWLTVGPAEAPLRGRVRLRIPAGVAYIWDCRTTEEHRGRGLYTSLVARLARDAATAGSPTALICCDPENIASRRGILGAGFEPWRTVVVYQVGPFHALRAGGLHVQPGSIDLFSV